MDILIAIRISIASYRDKIYPKPHWVRYSEYHLTGGTVRATTTTRIADARKKATRFRHRVPDKEFPNVGGTHTASS